MVSMATESEDSESMEERRTPKIPVRDLPDVPMGKLPPHLEFQRSYALSTPQLRVIKAENIRSSGAYASMGVDNSMQFEVFRNNFRVEVVRLTENDMEFDMIGIDASLANAFRRILIAELPTMAIEKVLIANNTSVIQDEKMMYPMRRTPLFLNSMFAMKGAVHELKEIELEAHAVKGMGKVHAKWFPVATTWYRMLPEVVLLQDVENEEAEELVKKCPVKVFDIEDIGKGRKKATVAWPRSFTLCRECIRGDDWDKYVSLRRVKDHFIFTIESTGALPLEELFIDAVKILEDKCMRVITELS